MFPMYPNSISRSLKHRKGLNKINMTPARHLHLHSPAPWEFSRIEGRGVWSSCIPSFLIDYHVSLKRELSREDLVEYGCAAASGLAGIWTKIILNLINSQLSHIDGLSEVQQRLASHAMRMSTSSVLVRSFLAHHLFHSPSHLQTRKPTISPFRFHKKKKKTTTSLRTTSTSLLFFLTWWSPLYISLGRAVLGQPSKQKHAIPSLARTSVLASSYAADGCAFVGGACEVVSGA